VFITTYYPVTHGYSHSAMMPGIYVCLISKAGKKEIYRPKHKANLPVNALYKYNIGRSKFG